MGGLAQFIRDTQPDVGAEADRLGWSDETLESYVRDTKPDLAKHWRTKTPGTLAGDVDTDMGLTESFMDTVSNPMDLARHAQNFASGQVAGELGTAGEATTKMGQAGEFVGGIPRGFRKGIGGTFNDIGGLVNENIVAPLTDPDYAEGLSQEQAGVDEYLEPQNTAEEIGLTAERAMEMAAGASAGTAAIRTTAAGAKAMNATRGIPLVEKAATAIGKSAPLIGDMGSVVTSDVVHGDIDNVPDDMLLTFFLGGGIGGVGRVGKKVKSSVLNNWFRKTQKEIDRGLAKKAASEVLADEGINAYTMAHFTASVDGRMNWLREEVTKAISKVDSNVRLPVPERRIRESLKAAKKAMKEAGESGKPAKETMSGLNRILDRLSGGEMMTPAGGDEWVVRGLGLKQMNEFSGHIGKMMGKNKQNKEIHNALGEVYQEVTKQMESVAPGFKGLLGRERELISVQKSMYRKARELDEATKIGFFDFVALASLFYGEAGISGLGAARLAYKTWGTTPGRMLGAEAMGAGISGAGLAARSTAPVRAAQRQGEWGAHDEEN